MTSKDPNKINCSSLLVLSMRVLSIGFFVNLVWENAQAFLYIGYRDFWQHFWTCFVASVVDGLVILLAYLVLALIYKDLYWPRHNSFGRYAVVVLTGGAFAVSFELWALETGEWAYTGAMPVVPLLEVGLTPLLQLMLLPVLTYYVNLEFSKSSGE